MFAGVLLRSTVVAAVLVAGVSLPGCKGRSSSRTRPEEAPKVAAPSARAEFELYAFAEIVGTIAPCGCTTEPLGGVQFAFGAIEADSEPKERLVVEPGSFLFPQPEGPLWPTDEPSWEQARDRARVLQQRFSALGEQLVSGVGPTDVAAPEGVRALADYPLPRVVANVPALSLPTHRRVTLESEGVQWHVGVTAVVDPEAPGAGKLGDVGAVQAALPPVIERLRGDGADAVVVLAQGPRAFAEQIAETVDGIDVVVVGHPRGVETERLGSPVVQRGKTFILEPGTQLQTMSVLRLSVAPSVKDVPDASGWTLEAGQAELAAELERVQARLTKFEADPEADPAFLARLRAERDGLAAKQRGQGERAPVVATFEQLKVTCKLPADRRGAEALAAYEAKVAAANEARFKGVKAPPAPAGTPSYAGIQACADCHEEAVEFWETTRHAGAYATLVDGNKQFDLTCVGCHVTGYRRPGGSEVVENAGLRDVQCEVCHGPGSLHVEDGGEDLTKILRDTPAELCATECHTPEHSDTFAYEAYLRDVLGPGHGDAKRKALGDGPTGRDLRRAGLEAAGGSCKEKMMAPSPSAG